MTTQVSSLGIPLIAPPLLSNISGPMGLPQPETLIQYLINNRTFNVKDYGAVGDGTTDDTVAIATAIAQVPASGGTVYFPTGTYRTSPIVITRSNIRLAGNGNASVLMPTGTGNGVTVDGSAIPNSASRVIIESLTIDGSIGPLANGLKLLVVARSIVRDVRVRNVSGAGFQLVFCVACDFQDCAVTSNDGAFTTTPVNGVTLDQRNPGENTTDCTFINLIVEGVSGSGWKLINADKNEFLGGTSESNDVGIEIDANCNGNAFRGQFLETNAIADILCSGFFTLFAGILAPGGLAHFLTGSYANTLLAGEYNNITADGGVVSLALLGIAYAGAITNNATTLQKRGVWNVPGSAYDADSITDVAERRCTLQQLRALPGPLPTTIAPLAGAGAGATATLDANSSDVAGVITITAAGVPAALNNIAVLTLGGTAFPSGGSTRPLIFLWPANAAAAAYEAASGTIASPGSGNQVAFAAGAVALVAATTYQWNYIIIG